MRARHGTYAASRPVASPKPMASSEEPPRPATTSHKSWAQGLTDVAEHGALWGAIDTKVCLKGWKQAPNPPRAVSH